MKVGSNQLAVRTVDKMDLNILISDNESNYINALTSCGMNRKIFMIFVK